MKSFFVSYNRANWAWAEWIVLQLLACSQSGERRRLARRLAGIAVIALLAVAVLGSLMAGRSQLAEARADVALSRQLTAQSAVALRDGQRDLALLLSVEALRAHDAVDSRSALLTALAYLPDSNPVGDRARPINGLAFSPDDKLAGGTREGKVDLMGIAGSARLPFARVNGGGPIEAAAVAFSPDGKLLASAGLDRSIIIQAAHTLELISTLTNQDGPISGLAFDPRTRLLASASPDGTIRLWDAAKPKEVRRELPTGAPVTSLVASQSGDRFAWAGANGRLTLWNPLTEQTLALGGPGQVGPVSRLAFSPNGQLLVSVGSDGSHLWNLNLARGAPAFRPLDDPLIGSNVQSVAFGPDGKQLVFGGYDGTLVLWDPVAGQRQALLVPPRASPATGGVPAAALALGSAAVTAVAFGPDGKILAAGSADGALTLWDLETTQPLAPPFKVHTAPLTSLSFSKNGKTLASGSTDLPLVTWSIDVQAWADLACGVANRSLTAAEQRQYLANRVSQAACPEPATGPLGRASQSPGGAWLDEGVSSPEQDELTGAPGTWPDPALWRSERRAE